MFAPFFLFYYIQVLFAFRFVQFSFISSEFSRTIWTRTQIEFNFEIQNPAGDDPAIANNDGEYNFGEPNAAEGDQEYNFGDSGDVEYNFGEAQGGGDYG